jgi:hypothetical protein
MLHWNTVSPPLEKYLKMLMQCPLLDDFRLVGGTALSLHLGHRMSVDIDLFTDQPYGSVNFETIEQYLAHNFAYYVASNQGLIGMGRSYLIGESPDDNIKLDIYYTDTFIHEPISEDGIRLATVGEITAMKIDVVHRGGRKKDFWDIHEILEQQSIAEMMALHALRHPYAHDQTEILAQLTNFTTADYDFDPICLKDKMWELIKYEIAIAARAHG